MKHKLRQLVIYLVLIIMSYMVLNKMLPIGVYCRAILKPEKPISIWRCIPINLINTS